MKKKLFGLATLAVVAFGLVACGGSKDKTDDSQSAGSEKESSVLKVGASASPMQKF